MSSKSSEDREYTAAQSIDDDTGTYWSEDSRTNVDGSTYDWYIIYDMGKDYQVHSIRIYGDGNIATAPCKVGTVKVCDDSNCNGESNILSGICSFSTTLEWQECNVTKTIGRYMEVRGGIYNTLTFPPTCANKVGSTEMQGFAEIDAEANNLPVINENSANPSPLDYGNDVQFTINWSDLDTKEKVKMFICKNNSMSGGESPSCPGGEWCSRAEDWTSDNPLSCNYTTTIEDIGQKGYWPFVCDDEGACSADWAMSPYFTVEDGTNPYYSNQADDAGDSVTAGTTVNVSAYWQDEVDLDVVRFRTNSSGSWTDNSTCNLGGETNESWCNKTIDTTNMGGKTVCWSQIGNDTAGNINETMGEQYECFDVNESCAIAIDLSNTLNNGISWSIDSLPADNIDSQGSGGISQTNLWVNVSATGCNADLYIKANGSLVSGVNSIGLGNETYCYNLTDSTVPGTACTPLDDSYSGNQIGSNLAGTSVVYLRFFLDVPSQQPAGSYKNTISIKAVQNGENP